MLFLLKFDLRMSSNGNYYLCKKYFYKIAISDLNKK